MKRKEGDEIKRETDKKRDRQKGIQNGLKGWTDGACVGGI
jgi:hypothetical protein